MTLKIETPCIDETKLDASFPLTEFKIYAYHLALFRKDRNPEGGRKNFLCEKVLSLFKLIVIVPGSNLFVYN